MSAGGSEFAAYGASHWMVLALATLGAGGLVLLGTRADERRSRRISRLLGVAVLVLNLGFEISSVQPTDIEHALPLHLSDLAPLAAAYALWSWRGWAYALTYYWGLTLTIQALLTPALRGPDFPSATFLAFFAIHVIVIWAAIFLTWGIGMRPGWRGYRFAVGVTVCWAAAMVVFNAVAGTNYGFLNAKPPTGSLLDVLGPWPWYLLPEAALVLGAWALMTVRWRRRQPPTGSAPASGQGAPPTLGPW